LCSDVNDLRRNSKKTGSFWDTKPSLRSNAPLEDITTLEWEASEPKPAKAAKTRKAKPADAIAEKDIVLPGMLPPDEDGTEPYVSFERTPLWVRRLHDAGRKPEESGDEQPSAFSHIVEWFYHLHDGAFAHVVEWRQRQRSETPAHVWARRRRMYLDAFTFLTAYHRAVQGYDGKFVLSCIEPSRKPGVKDPAPIPFHFGIGNVAEMVAEAIGRSHYQNIYLDPALRSTDLSNNVGKGKRGTRRRGGKDDIVAPTSLSVEEDLDSNQPKLLTLPPGLEPSFVVETSHDPAQNRHFHYIFDRLVSKEEAEELQELMFRKCGGDPNSNKDISHMWRVPGCWNHPYQKKLNPAKSSGRRPRPREPQEIKTVGGTGKPVDVAALKAALLSMPDQTPPKRVRPKKDAEAQPPLSPEEEKDELAECQVALACVPADDREVWLTVGMALKQKFGEAGRSLWDEWSATSDKYDEDDQDRVWRSFKGNGVTAGSIFHLAKQYGYQPEGESLDAGFEEPKEAKAKAKQQPEKTSPAKTPEPSVDDEIGSGPITLMDFYAVTSIHKYMLIPTRGLWTAESVNSKFKHGSSKRLDKYRGTEAVTWSPGLPLIIRDRLMCEGGWIDRVGASTINTYRPPILRPGDPNKAGRWLDHIGLVYPDNFEHLIDWLAQRAQFPGVKINHALLMGGPPGIGKDTILAPVRRARRTGPTHLRFPAAPHDEASANYDNRKPQYITP